MDSVDERGEWFLAVSLIEATKTFRKLRGYRGMPKLVAALRAHDANLKSSCR